MKGDARLRPRATMFAAAVAAWMTCGAVAGQTNPTDPIRTPIMQNDTVAVTHLRFAPGTRENVHTHPFPVLIVQITSGEIAVQEQNVTKRSQRVGEVWYVPTDRPHSLTTIENAKNSIDLLAVALLPTRPPAPAAPATEAPPGITRATLVDNNDLRVVRARFAPEAREPVHTHPNDLLTIQLTRGKLDIQMGTEHQSQEREPGYVHFIPRNVNHAYASEDTKPFELLSVAVK